VRVTATIFSNSVRGSFATASRLPESTVLKGSTLFNPGFSLQHRHALQAIDQLRVDRMLNPQRAVLIKGGNALLGWNEFCPSGFRGGADKVDDGLFGRAIIPRGQRVLGST
jgi:hypothetical protein